MLIADLRSFQGLLTLQTYIYYENSPEDSWRLKSLVGVVLCLDFTHLILICQACYHYLVDNWGNEAALLESTIVLDMHLILVGAASVLSQAYFLRSNHNQVLVGSLAALCTATAGLDIVMAVRTIRNRSVTTFATGVDEILAMFIISAATDLFIAVLLCYYLQRGCTTFEFQHVSFLPGPTSPSVVSYNTIATGLATSLLSVGCVYLIIPDSFVFIAMHFSLARMYTNSLLATLNLRRKLRAALVPASGMRSIVIASKAGFSFQAPADT
ncbi:hypothetical protein B0H17DRAFT_1215842 [Mycena rosella]|uniref:DUF6534 domain-containing protein n=1 Tax=Mycena rosella TaxID=1033263 RepID=A0AAD7CD77_MYCRO|nr:hypothetical protein B0H17DRAFT_1215842 [Mycena rosella]